jgi:ubiquinone/menaquinone biosynthesis C-methylase UbiE
VDQTVYLQPAERQPKETIKACCVALYDSDELTKRLGELLALQPGDRVLDVASGVGTSAIFLAQIFGCQVVGIDFAVQNVDRANANAAEAGLTGLVQFKVGDAERLPFDDNEFDALICECAFCTFPSKPEAANEFARVLRPGGKIGLSDLTRSGPLPAELDSLLAWVACIADAQPVDTYISILAEAGFSMSQVEIYDEALADLIHEIRGKLLVAELMSNLNKIDLPDWIDMDEAGRLAKLTAETVNQGLLGYALLSGTLPTD